jgi:hypothetical protein
MLLRTGILVGHLVEHNAADPPGGLGSVATTGVILGDFGSVAMIRLSRRFFGSVARKGVRGEEVRR